ncbi:hypothetical protein ACEPAF_8512 [Sanghuangporus sanghuang]
MKSKTLHQYDALIFDVYGTLIDWETGIYTALKPVLERASSSFSRRDALLAFFSVEKDVQVQHPTMPYNELLAAVHSTFATRIGTASTPEENDAFGGSIAKWPAFPDTAEALASLKKHYKLIVLSNVDNHSFNTFSRPILESKGGTFDIVLTAQDLGAYKPDPANFKAALKAIEEKFGIGKEKVLVTANSLFHDHEPANALGICSAWIEREAATIGVDSGSSATYDFRFKTLGEMAEAREKNKVDHDMI